MRRNITKLSLALCFATLLPATAVVAAPNQFRHAPIPATMPADSEIALETITDRYDSGAIKVVKEVAMDVNLNFVNHGDYKMLDEQGNEIAHGVFKAGLRDGKWVRIYQKSDSPLFAQAPYKNFEGPFRSEVTFIDGLMQGAWIITDAQERKISEIHFTDSLRDGKLMFFSPNGEIAREIDFRGGVIDGFDRTYNASGEIAAEQQYVDGQRYVLKGDTYISTKKKSEGYFLYPRMAVATRDQWWDATLATFGHEDGEPVRHGAYNSWHVNGQPRTTGEYKYGNPVGEFVWWHANGQVAIRGGFADGLHHGNWQWWHPNGMRSAKGQYIHGARVGRWLQWKEYGALADAKDNGEGSREVAGSDEAEANRLPEDAAAARRLESARR